MASNKVVIFGLGEMAEVMHFYLTHDSDFEVVAFTADEAFVKSGAFCGLPVVPFEAITREFPPDQFAMLVALGYSRINSLRAEKYLAAKARGYRLVSYVSRRATVWPGLEIGDNCIIFEDNTIQPFTRIGNDVVMWSGNHLGHHSSIGDHCFITSHVVISGGVAIGERAFIGVNAAIRDHIKIGARCIIGMGCVITAEAPEGSVYKAIQSEPLPVHPEKVKI